MTSEINPSLTPVNSLDNFRFWCQKVLPLVYDDSLSYYEVLGKMVVQLNDVIDNVNADTENVLTLKDAFLELQTYVNNFFDDIDQLASYAERAEAAQTAANTSAVNAATSASNASQSSLAAMDARDTAVAARQAAQASANNASTAATNANIKANEAAQSAITAQTAQASASQSATLAATDRTAAQTAASTATTKANEANTSATNAETSAENAAQSEANAEELANNIRENLDNIQQNTQDISDLKESVSDLVCSNLMGNEANVLYPVYIATGEYCTVSTSDGSVFATDSTLKIYLIGQDGQTQIDYYSLKNGQTSRTFRVATTQNPVYYLRFNEVPSVPLMVNYGSTPLQYQEYFPDIQTNVKENTEQIDGLLRNSYVLVDRPRIINGMLSTTTGERDYTLASVGSYVITPDLLHVKAGSIVRKSSTTTMRVYEYDANDNYIGYTQQNAGVNSYEFSEDKYVRLFFLISDESNVKTVFENVTFELIVYDYKKPDIIATFMGLNGEHGNGTADIVSGDACLIQFPNSEVMEIDFHTDDENNTDYAAYRDSLALRGVRYLKYIVFTHWHDDHMGLFAKAVTNNVIKIDGATAYLPQLITSELATARRWETYYTRQNDIIGILQNHNCTIVYPQDGDTLKIDDAIISWYNCDHSRYNVSGGEYYSTNYNDWSLCFNLRYENTVINYSADLGPIGQKAMAGTMPKADVLKAMHHGWDNGVNNLIPAFINNVSPDMVLVCNGYAHRPTSGNLAESNMLKASSPIYTWGEANGVPVYPTVTNGNIDLLVNEYGYRLDGHYTRFIRNDKNWSYSDNSEHIET